MKKINKKILVTIFIFLIVILLSISYIIANNSNNTNLEINNEKIYYQIKYLDSQIIYMSNSFNNIIDWNKLQKDLKQLYNYWNGSILDFNNLDIEKTNLTDFGKTLDNLSIAIKNQNREESLKNLLKLYEKLIIYNKSLNYNENYTNILYAKYNLLISYSIVENGNWTLTHESILKCDNYLSNLVNSMDINQYEQYNINQAYIAVKELENLINIKDIDLYYMKYNIAMEKIQNI